MPEATELDRIAEWMRQEWNDRARQNAERFVYTRDAQGDAAGFEESGRANYHQLVRPYLPLLLNGAGARDCRALEIGCGVGRMTQCFAEWFGEVHAVDISPEMIALARSRLAGWSNVRLHMGSGFDLQPLPDSYFDLVFSYIVFQHIPAASVIASYIREAGRVLKPGGAFKFQVNGDQSAAYRAHVRDTWQGETFSRDEVQGMLKDAGLVLLAAEDPGTQYFVVTARKGKGPDPRTYHLPGEDGGWQPVLPETTLRLLSVGGGRLYTGLYFWPADPHPEHTVTMTCEGTRLGSLPASGPGDHFLEWTLPPELSGTVEVRIEIAPECRPECRPALRIAGIAAFTKRFI